MSEKNIKAVIEALLFAAGDEIEFREIVRVIDSTPKRTKEILDEMILEYSNNDRGIMLRRLEDSYQLCTKPELYEDIKAYFEPRTVNYLSNAAMEALSIIAYNQPVTRAIVEKIRGVNSDGVITRLLEKGLIEEVGKSEAPGHANLYGTTTVFLRSLGYESLSQLPDLEENPNKNLSNENEQLKFNTDEVSNTESNDNQKE